MKIFVWILLFLLVINVIAALITVFRKPRSISSVLAWMMTLIFLPGIGFIIYLFCGRGIDGQEVFKLSDDEKQMVQRIKEKVDVDNKKAGRDKRYDLLYDAKVLNRYFRNMDASPLAKRNSLQLFTDGQEKFQALFEDIRAAKETVHVEYYAFFNDTIGNQFLDVLIEKLHEGVEVYLIYDPWGSPGANKKFFARYVDAGGKVAPFITSRDMIRKTRLNYHLHRKIVQEIFIMDWNASVKYPEERMTYHEKYFKLPEDHEVEHLSLQVVSDGPDSEEEILKSGFVRMIFSAEKSVWIQTPYLIPDDSMINALLVAVRSGVDVRIMIPCMPDHPFIYRATQYYANYLHKRGIKIYIYDSGFIHAKTMVIDDELAMVGTTNQDIRSYSLNFEVSTFIYNPEIAWMLAQVFEEDIEKSVLLTDEIIKKQGYWLRFKQNFSRLLSPVL